MHAGLRWRRGGVEQSRIGCLEHQLLHLLVEHATQEPITLRIDLSYYFIIGRPQAVFVQVHLFVPGECRLMTYGPKALMRLGWVIDAGVEAGRDHCAARGG